jgi:hypothetical protein
VDLRTQRGTLQLVISEILERLTSELSEFRDRNCRPHGILAQCDFEPLTDRVPNTPEVAATSDSLEPASQHSPLRARFAREREGKIARELSKRGRREMRLGSKQRESAIICVPSLTEVEPHASQATRQGLRVPHRPRHPGRRRSP